MPNKDYKENAIDFCSFGMGLGVGLVIGSIICIVYINGIGIC